MHFYPNMKLHIDSKLYRNAWLGPEHHQQFKALMTNMTNKHKVQNRVGRRKVRRVHQTDRMQERRLRVWSSGHLRLLRRVEGKALRPTCLQVSSRPRIP